MNQFRYDCFCPICQEQRVMHADSAWFRDSLVCPSCGSVVRERALALVLEEVRPDWRRASVHESSPVDRGISRKLAKEAKKYVASQFFSDVPAGSVKDGFRSENLETQTFADESFDIVITLDVMEHVFDPEKVYREIWRTLRPKGLYIHTFPIQKQRTEAFVARASVEPSGAITYHAEPQYHGNPVSEEGSLVTFDYGYDVSKQIPLWAPFDVRVLRFWDQTHGIIGEFTDVVLCRKR